MEGRWRAQFYPLVRVCHILCGTRKTAEREKSNICRLPACRHSATADRHLISSGCFCRRRRSISRGNSDGIATGQGPVSPELLSDAGGIEFSLPDISLPFLKRWTGVPLFHNNSTLIPISCRIEPPLETRFGQTSSTTPGSIKCARKLAGCR